MGRRAAWILGLAAAAVFFVGVATDNHVLRLWTKPWPVVIMAVVVFTAARHRYGRFVGLGLVACLAGDLFLELGDATFLYGVGAFLVGHVLYTFAYLGRSRALRPLLALPFVAWGTAVVLWLRPGLVEAGMLVPVAVYTAAIMVMLWRAAACWEKGGVSRTTLLALGGAFAFALSDSLLAVNRFHSGVPHVRYTIMLLYWLGQLGITLSALHLEENHGRPR